MENATISGLSASTDYWFAVRAVDEAENASRLSNVVTARTATGAIGLVLSVMPQPAHVPVKLFWQGNPEGVVPSIGIYDLSRQLRRTLALGMGRNGTADWDGLDTHGRVMPASIWLAKLLDGKARAKVILIR